MNLFFDTETTGLYDSRIPLGDHRQPHIVQLAALLCDDDGSEIAQLNTIIRPDGWIIPDASAAIHGITTERAKKVGVDIDSALRMFRELKWNAKLWVAHNFDFDCSVISSVAYRQFLDDIEWPASQCFCTMKATIPICKLPNQYGYAEYKWPKLIESYRHFFGVDFENAHDALADVRACAKIFYHLKQNFPSEQ